MEKGGADALSLGLSVTVGDVPFMAPGITASGNDTANQPVPLLKTLVCAAYTVHTSAVARNNFIGGLFFFRGSNLHKK